MTRLAGSGHLGSLGTLEGASCGVEGDPDPEAIPEEGKYVGLGDWPRGAPPDYTRAGYTRPGYI